MLRAVTNAEGHDDRRLDLDQIVGEGARRMLVAALAAERDEHGRRLVVGDGHARQRDVTTVAGEQPAADGGTVAA